MTDPCRVAAVADSPPVKAAAAAVAVVSARMTGPSQAVEVALQRQQRSCHETVAMTFHGQVRALQLHRRRCHHHPRLLLLLLLLLLLFHWAWAPAAVRAQARMTTPRPPLQPRQRRPPLRLQRSPLSPSLAVCCPSKPQPAAAPS